MVCLRFRGPPGGPRTPRGGPRRALGGLPGPRTPPGLGQKKQKPIFFAGLCGEWLRSACRPGWVGGRGGWENRITLMSNPAGFAIARILQCMAGGPCQERVWRLGPGDPDYAASARNRVVYTVSGPQSVVRRREPAPGPPILGPKPCIQAETA